LNYPFTSLTGITTEILGDTTPQLGGNLDLNSNDITGTGDFNVTGIVTATSFVKSSNSGGFLKADGTEDTTTYLTSYTETDTLDSVVGRGNTTSNNIQVGILTATALHTGAEGSAIRVTSNTISGPAELFIDPSAVGDDTGAVRIKGDLYVDGTTTQINSTTIELADFVVGIATTATTDLLADGAGITIGPDNTLLYDHTNTSLKSSENLNLATGKTYKINGTDVLSATTLESNVVNSSLTSVGTLTELNVSGIVTATSFSGSGSSLTDLTGASAATYGSSNIAPVITVDANGRITGITTAPISGSGAIASIVEDTVPQLGGDLDLNSNNITGTGDFNVTGIITATTFSGNLPTIDLTGTITNDQLNGSITNDKLVNSSIAIGGVTLNLGDTDATPAFNLSDATAYPYTSLTGITTEIVGDTTPQLGGDLDLNSNNITGTGNMNVTGIITATTFSGSGASLTSIPNGALTNSSIAIGGVTLNLGDTDATPAFDLSDATNYPYTSLTGISTEILYDTTPQLGGNLDLNSKLINGTGGIVISGIITGTTFSGSGASLTSIPNGALTNSSIAIGGVAFDLGDTVATPAFDLSDATNYPYTSLTGISTEILYDTTPQLGGNLDLNSNNITGTGDFNVTGIITATSFVGSASNMTGLTGASAATYGSSDATPVIVVDSNGRITGISTVATAGSGGGGSGISSVVEDTAPQLGGNLDLNSKLINGTGGINITGIVTATSFSGSGSSLTGLTGASAATYGSSSETPVIVVDSDGRITGISTAAVSGGGGGSGTVTGISSDGELVGTGVTTINFVGTGITVSITGGQADITIPTSEKNVHREIAIEGQTVVPDNGTVEYTVGHCDVYLNGSKLDSTEYTATNGTSITLTTGASVGDVIEIVGFEIGVDLNLVGLSDVVDDLSPQLGGPLDLNSRLIQGTGGINITGIATATTFSGSGASLTSIPNSALDNSSIAIGGLTLNLGDTDAHFSYWYFDRNTL
jgi:hypothetical protein